MVVLGYVSTPLFAFETLSGKPILEGLRNVLPSGCIFATSQPYTRKCGSPYRIVNG
jgi:hypothetical protein